MASVVGAVSHRVRAATATDASAISALKRFVQADEVGADRVELSTWAFNESAQSLFLRLGFSTDFLRQSRPVGTDRTALKVRGDDDTLT